MTIIKGVLYILILISCSLVGILISRKYHNRVKELKEFKKAFSMFETKIKFTYEPIPEIFRQISKNVEHNVAAIFQIAADKMNTKTAGNAWSEALGECNSSIKEEDKEVLRGLGKLLGKTDLEGQVSEIELTSQFLDSQIQKAEQEKEKNEKLYKTLGVITGMGVVIILM